MPLNKGNVWSVGQIARQRNRYLHAWTHEHVR